MSLEEVAKLAKVMGNQNSQATTIIGYADGLGKINYFEATIKGKIVDPRGSIGWGWDFIFQPEGYDKTFAEMTIEQKNELSMRRLAIEKLRKFVEEKYT